MTKGRWPEWRQPLTYREQWERAAEEAARSPVDLRAVVDGIVALAGSQAGAEGLADLNRRDARARASLGCGELDKPLNAHSQERCCAVGCGVVLGDPQDGPELCRTCGFALDSQDRESIGNCGEDHR